MMVTSKAATQFFPWALAYLPRRSAMAVQVAEYSAQVSYKKQRKVPH